MGKAGKWVAEDRGAFEGKEEKVPEVRRGVIRFPLVERLTAVELVVLYSFRAALPVGKVINFPV